MKKLSLVETGMKCIGREGGRKCVGTAAYESINLLNQQYKWLRNTSPVLPPP